MSDFKKIYHIEITGAIDRPNIWYANKVGKRYFAELKSSSVSTNLPAVFYVNPCQFVHTIDVRIISEKLVEKYYK